MTEQGIPLDETIHKGGWERFKEWLNSVPDCPSCKGKGICGINDKGFNITVWWHGEHVTACAQCEGKGKV